MTNTFYIKSKILGVNKHFFISKFTHFDHFTTVLFGMYFIMVVIFMLCLTVHFVCSVQLFCFYHTPATSFEGTDMRTIYITHSEH